MKNMQKILSERNVVWLTAIVCVFHIILGLLKYFLSVTSLNPLDHTLILISLAAWIMHMFFWGKRPRLRKEYIILAAFFLWYLLSCQVMTDTYHRDWFSYNQVPLYDTLLLVALIFPLGVYLAKKGSDAFIRILIHILVFAWTGFIIYVLIHVFQNKIIHTPSGGEIGMDRVIQLCLNCNPNTTGLLQYVMIMIALFFIFTDHRPLVLRICYGISCFINMVALVLSNSRTSFISIQIIFAAFIFSTIYNTKSNWSLFKRIAIGITAAVISVLLLICTQKSGHIEL